jgi:Zn finger protein HypA/HybF involved in hydrogenase expression
MSLLDKLERALSRFAIPNVTLYLVIGQVFVLLGAIADRIDLRHFVLVPALVMDGQWWRIFSFLLMPPPASGTLGLVFVAFAWYLFYLMGNSLEATWGTLRYNLFLLLGVALTVGAAFLTPRSAATNAFLAGSVFLAFAYLNPDFELALFFILPVKIKWLALVTWVLYAYSFVTGSTATRLQVVAAVGNFLIFFGRDIWLSMRYRKRTMARKAERIVREQEPRHVCYVCGKTDRTHPQLDFRYCSKCAGDQCYCPDHIHTHAHVVAANESKAG